MLSFIHQYSGEISIVENMFLVAITGFYAYLTKGLLTATANQSRSSLSPVIGIKITRISITPVIGPKRRNMSVELELCNVGNAPAIELLVDAEIVLRYSQVDADRVIPARFEPDMLPYVRPGEVIAKPFSSFGNKLITHFFDDVREASRLNRHRIETSSTEEYYKTSLLRIITYYRNSLGQYFRSHYETEIALWSPGKTGTENIPGDDEGCEVHQIYVPRPIFHAGLDDEKNTKKEIEQRNTKRPLSGW